MLTKRFFVIFCICNAIFSCGKSAQTQSHDRGLIKGYKAMPIIRLIPIRPIGAKETLAPESNGCFELYDQSHFDKKKKNFKFSPEKSAKVFGDFLRDQFENRISRLELYEIEKSDSGVHATLFHASWKNVEFGIGTSYLYVTPENKLEGVKLCVFDFIPEKEPSGYCSQEEAFRLWSTYYRDRLKVDKEYVNIYIKTRYQSLNPEDPLLLTPYWKVGSYSYDNANLLVSQIDCSVVEIQW